MHQNRVARSLVFNEFLDAGALQPFLVVTEVAGQNREIQRGGEPRERRFFHAQHRPDNDTLSIIADEFGRHRREFTTVKEVQQQCFQGVIRMVPKRYLGGTEPVRLVVENSPAQPGT